MTWQHIHIQQSMVSHVDAFCQLVILNHVGSSMVQTGLAFQGRQLNLLSARAICSKCVVIREGAWIETSYSSIFESLLLTPVTQHYL